MPIGATARRLGGEGRRSQVFCTRRRAPASRIAPAAVRLVSGDPPAQMLEPKRKEQGSLFFETYRARVSGDPGADHKDLPPRPTDQG